MLHTGTVLDVKEVWTNFYGSYYRCETTDGIYDIPIEKAKDVTEDLAEASPYIGLRIATEDLKRELDKAYGEPMRKILFKAVDSGWTCLLKILMPICVLIRQIRKGGEE